MKPIQVASRFESQDRDRASIPLLEQLQALNKSLKYQYPNMDTVHDCNVAYAASLVADQETWEKGLDTDLKILGIVEHRRTVDGIEIVEPVIVFTCRKVAGNVIPAMEAWGGRVPFRTDGTFRLTRMYVPDSRPPPILFSLRFSFSPTILIFRVLLTFGYRRMHAVSSVFLRPHAYGVR